MGRLKKAYMFSIQRRPLFMGMTIGITLSLIIMPLMDDSCSNSSASFHFARDAQDDKTEPYDPVIRVRHPSFHQRRQNRQMIRPRYYSTELGIREKIFVAILTTSETVGTLGSSLNSTLHKHVSKVTFFFLRKPTEKNPLPYASVVPFAEDTSTPLIFLVLQYLITHSVEDYDFYFLTRDSTYIHGRKLYEFASRISITYDVHVGTKRNSESKYCTLSAGILISNSMLKQLAEKLPECLNATSFEDEDENFGKCLLHSSNIACSNDAMEQEFSSLSLPSDIKYDSSLRNLRQLKEFPQALTVHPVYQPQGHQWLHIVFSEFELQNSHIKLHNTQEKLSSYDSKIPQTREVGTWPVGVDPPFKPEASFDVLPWIVLNGTHQFLSSDFSVLKELRGIEKAGLEDIVHSCVRWLSEQQDPHFRYTDMINVYQRLDPTRGMEYIIDVMFAVEATQKVTVKRFQAVRPLSKVELMPVPYVTEHTRVVLVLPVQVSESSLALEFLDNYAKTCLEKQDNTILLLVLFYGPGDPGKGDPNDVFSKVKKLAVTLTTKFHSAGAKIAWLSIRTIGKLPSEFAMLDLVVRKLSPDSLVLVCRLGMQLRTEFINRVRMNTVNKVQAFFPIPFVQYHPAVLSTLNINPDLLEIKKDHGHYDYHSFEYMSFYVFDYLAARKAVIRELPVVRVDEDLKEERLYMAEKSVYTVFIQSKLVHVMRAVEPELRVHFRWQNCETKPDRQTLQNCYLSQERNLGSKTQLAKLVSKYETPQEI